MGSGVTVTRTGREHLLACTQGHFSMEDRHLVRSASVGEFKKDPDFARRPDEEHHEGKDDKEGKTDKANDLTKQPAPEAAKELGNKQDKLVPQAKEVGNEIQKAAPDAAKKVAEASTKALK